MDHKRKLTHTTRMLASAFVSFKDRTTNCRPVVSIRAFMASLPVVVSVAAMFARIAESVSRGSDMLSIAKESNSTIRALYKRFRPAMIRVPISNWLNDDTCIVGLNGLKATPHYGTGTTNCGFLLEDLLPYLVGFLTAIWTLHKRTWVLANRVLRSRLENYDIWSRGQVRACSTDTTFDATGVAFLDGSQSGAVAHCAYKATVRALHGPAVSVLGRAIEDNEIGSVLPINEVRHSITSAWDRVRTVVRGRGGAEAAFSGATLVPSRSIAQKWEVANAT